MKSYFGNQLLRRKFGRESTQLEHMSGTIFDKVVVEQ